MDKIWILLSLLIILAFVGLSAGQGCPSECPNECDNTTNQCYCVNCDNPATCNPVTKACTQCNTEGWQTPFCTKPCIRNCLTCTENSPNSCATCKVGYAAYTDVNNNEGCCSEGCDQVNGEYACDVATGECSDGCTSGKYGTECNQDCGTSIPNCNICDQDGTNPVTCSACLSGFQYNTSTNRCCKDLCGGQCPIANCDACDENFLQGVFCTQCSSNYFAQENDEQCCKENCLQCTSGDCEICVDGYYPSGDICLPCSDLCESPGCSSTTGSCTADCVDTTNYNWLGPDFYCCSINCVNNSCEASGDCLSSCSAGFYGPRCDDPCPADCEGGLCARDTGNCLTGCNNDKYGQKCENDCTCQKGDCDWETGECLCDKNFWGVNCELSCSPSCEQEDCLQDNGNCLNGECKLGFYGNQCEFTCDNCTDTNCNDATGVCISGCKPGYHGDKCNGLCRDIYTNCAVCDRVSPATCTECVNNFYEADCSAQCNDNCKANVANGITTCRQSDGYCDDGCDPFSWGNQCQNTCPFCADELCNRTSGLCLCDQSKGSCDTRDLCARGKFESDCNSDCSSFCKPETDNTIRCDVTTGRCLNGCPDGRWGNECTSLCASGCGGQSNACNQTNGYCLEDKCDPEFFGLQCENECNSQCIDKTCDRVEGTCGDCKDPPTVNCPTANCSVGFWGSNCDKVCSSGVCPSGSSCFYCEGNTCERYTGKCLGCIIGRFGDSCTSSCDNCVNGICSQADGTCDATLGCDAGWYGPGCTKACHDPCATCNRNTGVCDTCNPGYYGPNCTLSCSSFCVASLGGDIRCDKDSGNCLEDACLPGHYGRKCDQQCNLNCARSNNECHFLNGSCIDGCDNTFYGPMCEDSCSTNCLDGTCLDEFDNCVKGCIDGKYGNKCDQDCSVNCNGDLCERNGRCVFGCEVGWYANLCDSECEASKTCIDDTCHRLLGYCEECDKTNRNYTCREADCPAGFSGLECTTPCSTGVKVANCKDNLCERYNDGKCIGCEASYYGFKCDISCNGCIDGECSQDNGTCASGCQDRWYGNLCDVSCPYNCVKCNRDTGACLVCDLGYWGPNCGFTCSQKCKDTIIGGTSVIKCDKHNGHCEDQTACKPNYFGPKCDQNCSTNCIQTNGNNVCNITNGACAAGCITGWFADDCRSKCNDNCLNKNCAGSATNCLQGCIPTYTGDDCQSRCNDKCVNDLCARNGYCSSGCEDGFYTDDCSKGCDPNFACNDGTCDRNNGLCTECDLTNPGPNCPTANCTRGKWGLTCEQDCPSNCLYELCNRTTGKCRGCKKGFYGNACTSNCTNCLDIGIEALCVQDTAVCISGCIPGYWKLTCTDSCDADCATCDRDTSACTTCRPSRHGVLCDQDCNNGCTLSGDGNRYCDKLDGSCIPAGVCVDGFWGVSCQDSCNENCAKENGVLRCRNADGTCTSGCEPTWFGNTCIDRCSTRCKNRLCSGVADNCLQGCADGFYGSNRCNSVCSSNCANTGCDPITGECDDQGCRTGFWDLRCDKPCIYPCLDTTCNRETGSCLDCGLEIPGPQCPNISCPIRYYTSTCNVVCPTANCKGGVCDRKSGNCSTGCKDGFFGETCSENCQCRSPGTKACLQTGQCECNSGFYGPNCEFECSDGCVGTTCDADTGECTCRPGRYESRCELICDKCTNENCNADNGNCNEGCKANHWGSQCTADCPTNCETCTQLEGQCITCVGAFHGAVCESTCSSNCVAVNNVRACEKNNGRCSAGCEDSWFGSQCDEQCLTCESDRCNRDGVCTLGCKAGKWGSLCDLECGTNCVKTSGISMCDRDTGECVNGCVAGWFGQDCVQQCNALCKGQLCTGASDNCDDGCIDGRYGAGCSEVCSTNCLNGICSNIGVCSDGCEKTFYGGKCNVACRELCTDNTCNQDTGDCGDCATPNKGPLCPVDATTPAPTAEKGELTVPQIIGICVGGTAAVILIIVLIIVCLWQTRRTSRLEKTASAIYTPEMLETLSRFSHKSSQPGYYTPRGPPTSSLYHQTEISYGGPVPMKGQPPLDDWEDTSPLAVTDFSSESSLTEAKDLMDGGLDNVHIVDYTDTVSRSIKVGELLRYIETALKYDRLAEEYKSLQSGLRHPHDFGKTSQNADKNRYKDIVPYDKNRVVLKMRDSSGSDYINASYIHGFHNKREFIASQGPTESTVTEFLQMLWQEDCGKLVTLTNVIEGGMRKCFQFWPEVDKRLSFGSFLITNQEETKYAMFVVRKLQLEMNKSDRRRITHFHFTSWPDQGIPNDVMPLVELHHKVKNSGAYGMGPTVVHCSAGIGRTGTYIALDFLVDQALLTESLDILKAVDRLREQRVNMVQTPDQYEFLYKAVAAAVLTNKSRVHFTGFHSYCRSLLQRDAFSSESPLHQQFEILQRLSRVLGYEGDCITAKLPENVDKNRDMNILANDDNRPYLSTQVPGTTDYINAIFVPSYLNRFGYIVTQMPLSNTIPDFWRLVYDHDVRTIVMLNDVASFEQDRTFYWPNLRGETKLGPFTIESVDETHGDNYGTSTLVMKFASKQKNDARTVKLFRCSCWPANSPTPSTPQAFLDLVMDVKSWQEQFREDPIVVHCINGAERSGLFCALATNIERLEADRELSVMSTVHQMKAKRPQLMDDPDQYGFCYKTVLAHLEKTHL